GQKNIEWISNETYSNEIAQSKVVNIYTGDHNDPKASRHELEKYLKLCDLCDPSYAGFGVERSISCPKLLKTSEGDFPEFFYLSQKKVPVLALEKILKLIPEDRIQKRKNGIYCSTSDWGIPRSKHFKYPFKSKEIGSILGNAFINL